MNSTQSFCNEITRKQNKKSWDFLTMNPSRYIMRTQQIECIAVGESHAMTSQRRQAHKRMATIDQRRKHTTTTTK